MKYLKDGWLILLLAIIFGSGLAYVNAALKAQIEKNKKDETYNQIPTLILGEKNVDASKTKVNGKFVSAENKKGEKFNYYVLEQTVKADTGVYTVYICYNLADKGDKLKPCNFIVKNKGNGFADMIETLIGLNADVSKITGVYVLDQKETPGLGDKITSDWDNQYRNKLANGELEVGKKLNAEQMKTKIDAIGGATISSQSLTNIVNKAILSLQKDLMKKEIGLNKEAK